MSLLDDLFAIMTSYAAARGLSEGRVSTLVFGDGTRIKHLRAGGDMGVRRVERAMLWLSDNWPDGIGWPADVPRPIRTAAIAHDLHAPLAENESTVAGEVGASHSNTHEDLP